MKETQTLPFIDVDDLQVGVFVHLDLGWMSHPFPRSNFRISTPEQIATLRGLGLKRVRWSPQDSDVEAVVASSSSSTSTSFTSSAPSSSKASASLAGAQGLADVAPSPPSQASLTPLSAGSDALTKQATVLAQLAAQNESLQTCERHFAYATSTCEKLTELSTSNPLAAAEQARQLSHQLINQMLAEQELCIRLLTEAAGDKVSAHAVNVALLSLLLGRFLGWDASELCEMGIGALLHDIGKLDVPHEVHHSQSHFSPSEQRAYEAHVAQGVARARRMGLSPLARLVVAEHHELSDGTGFPTCLSGERVSRAARVVALVNRYDNLCNPPMMAQAVTPHEAVAQIYALQQEKYDAVILAAFIKMMGVYPAGSIVQLNDGRFALVVGVHSGRPLRPRLQVYDPKVSHQEALILDMTDHPELSIRRSCKPLMLPPEALAYLAPRQRVAYFFEPVRSQALESGVLKQ